MKRTLAALVTSLALGSGCAANIDSVQVQMPLATAVERDGKYDFIDDYVNPEKIAALSNASYMVMSESKYKNSKGEEIRTSERKPIWLPLTMWFRTRRYFIVSPVEGS